jgi:hypothetical protein
MTYFKPKKFYLPEGPSKFVDTKTNLRKKQLKKIKHFLNILRYLYLI